MRKRSALMKLIDKEMLWEDLPAMAELENRIPVGPPAGSGITTDTWRCWHEHGWVSCPKKPNTTCTDPKCRIGIGCQAMAAFGLAGDGTPLAHVQRPTCRASNREGRPCGNKVVPGKRRCKYHGGLSTGPRTSEGRARIAAAQKLRWASYRNEPYPAVVDPYRDAVEETAWDSFMSI